MPSPLPNKIKKEAIRLMKENQTNVEISKELGVSTTTLANWRKSSGLPNSTKSFNISGYTDEIKQEAIQQMKDDKTNAEISKELGVSTTTLAKWRRSSGLQNSTKSKSNGRYSDEIRQECLQQMREGKSYKEISELFGVPRKTLGYWRRRAGIESTRKAIIRLTPDLINDVIDMIREQLTIGEIVKNTGLARYRIHEIHANELREGNKLPALKKGISRRKKYSDHELIELAFLNPGFGFQEFVEFLSVSSESTFDLFQELKKFSAEDPYAVLQDTSNHEEVSFDYYKKITGRSTVPYSHVIRGGGNGRRGGTDLTDILRKAALPPQDFVWGEFKPNNIY